MLAADSQRLLPYYGMCSLTIECVRLPDVLLRTSVNNGENMRRTGVMTPVEPLGTLHNICVGTTFKLYSV